MKHNEKLIRGTELPETVEHSKSASVGNADTEDLPWGCLLPFLGLCPHIPAGIDRPTAPCSQPLMARLSQNGFAKKPVTPSPPPEHIVERQSVYSSGQRQHALNHYQILIETIMWPIESFCRTLGLSGLWINAIAGLS